MDDLHRRRVRRVVTGEQQPSAGPRPALPPSTGTPPPRPAPTNSAPPASGAPTPPPTASQVDQAEQSVRRRVKSLLNRQHLLEQALPQLRHTHVVNPGQAIRDQQHQVDTSTAARQREIRTNLHERHRQSQDELRRLSAKLAPGAAGHAWPEMTRDDLTGARGVAGYVRVGAITADSARYAYSADAGDAADLDCGSPIAALAALAGRPGWHLSGEPRAVDDLLLGTVCRLVAQVPAQHLSVVVFDPQFRGVLGPLAGLRRVHGAAYPPPTTDAAGFAQGLGQVLRTATDNTEQVTSHGAQSLTDRWTHSGISAGTLQVVVVLDYPMGLDTPTLDALRQCATAGPASGICLLIADQYNSPPASDAANNPLTHRLTTLSVHDRRWHIPGLPAGVTVTAEPAPTPAQVTAVIAAAQHRLTSATGPVAPLTQLLADDIATPWRHTSETALTVPIGVAGREPLTLSLSSQNPPHPNVLVGGAVGQGKSNLLLTLIYGLACRYSPHELELQLLDFKLGLEFRRFAADASGRAWLPHARILSLQSSLPFGVAVLRNLVDEKQRRADLFTAAGVASIDDYRTGGHGPMPRVLLVVDEFHKLFEGEGQDVDDAVTLMTDLAKQGRAFGIHLLLASQTTSGLNSLAVAGDAIYAQFPLRLSLKNTALESEAVLSSGNRAAADLTYRGEVILNRDYGGDPQGANIRGLVAYAEPQALADLQQRLWSLDQQHHPSPAPLVLVGTAYAPWDPARYTAHAAAHQPADLEHRGDDGLTVWLGQPVAVTSDPATYHLRADVDQCVAVVGPHTDLARAALRAMALTALPALRGGGRVTVLHGNPTADTSWLDEIRHLAQTWQVPIHDLTGTDATDYLRDQTSTSATEPLAHNLIMGVEMQRLRGMDTTAYTPDNDDGADDPDELTGLDYDQPTPRTGLTTLATDGALNGSYLIGWWTTLRSLETHLGPEAAGVGLYVTAGLGRDDLRRIASPHQEKITDSLRLGLFDPTRDELLRLIVPYDPSSSPADGTPQ